MSSKIIYLFLIFSLLNLTCYSQSGSLYKEINSRDYEQYKAVDTLLNKDNLLITTAKNIKGSPRITKLLLRRIEINDSTYFLLDANAYLESDSTFILPSIRFKVVSNQEIKNGIWLYAEFYSKKAKLFKAGESGINFKVDSIPPNLDTSLIPLKEGIYFVDNGALTKITDSQTEEAFNSYHKTGFYFIPNSGSLFRRYKIESIR
jgi:hypothetical protein